MKNWRDWDVSLSSYAMETNPIRLLSLSSNGWVAAAFEVDEGDVRKIKPNANCDVNLIELLFNHYRLELFPVCSCSLFLCRLSGIWFNLNFWFDIFQDWGLRGVRKLCHLSLSFTMKILLWKYSQESNLFWFMLNLHESTKWHDFCTFPTHAFPSKIETEFHVPTEAQNSHFFGENCTQGAARSLNFVLRGAVEENDSILCREWTQQ